VLRACREAEALLASGADEPLIEAKAKVLAEWYEASHRWSERAKELLAELRVLAKRCGAQLCTPPA
jgi:hypothetical protein